MQNSVFLPDDLQKVIDSKAALIGITTSAFITDFLREAFKDELNSVPSKSYATLYLELKDAILNYIASNNLKSGDKFTLRNIPYYANLSFTTVNGTHAIPAGIRARLGRSFNEDVRFNKTPQFSNIKRALTKSGKPAFSKADNTSAAVYEII